MSLENDIKNIMEADIFKPASEEEVSKRKDVLKAERDVKRKELETKLGRKLDTCPHCKADLREEGIITDETMYGTANLAYDDGSEEWDYIDSQTNDTETTAYHCGKCDGEIERGEDFDYEAFNS